MQIDPTRLNPAVGPGLTQATGVAAAPEAAAAPGTQAPAATTAAEGADRLALSQQAAEVRAAHEALAALPDTRTELVARLKAEIEAGTYQVSPEAVAAKMIP